MENQNPQPNQPRKDLEVLWTVEQVAQYLLVKKGTVYNWLSKGQVIDPAGIRHVGRSVRILRSEVERIAGNIKSNLKEQS